MKKPVSDISPPDFSKAVMSFDSHPPSRCEIAKADAFSWMPQIKVGSVDLVLTDPPYTISRKTGFSQIGPGGVERFAVNMEFGKWDKKVINLNVLCEQAMRMLRIGGTAIVFYDIWKLTTLADAMTVAGFKQLRIIHWEKTNPVPLNSKRNYLTNSREIAVLGVKGGKPTFKGEYDKGIYHYPIPNNGKRYHPTQKPLELFEKLIEKHSMAGDLIADPFLGCGTTAVAALRLGRSFTGCERDTRYVQISKERVRNAL